MRKLRKIDGCCAVVALYFIAKLSEDIVIDICKDHGFEAGEGMDDIQWKAAARDLGIRMRAVDMESMRLRTFVNKYPVGLYLVATRNHLFVVEGGIVVDPRHPDPPGLDRVIQMAWRVLKPHKL